MIKLKTQLTAIVSQKDIEVIIQEMINKQLGASTAITDTVFNWGANSVTVIGTQQDLSKVDTSQVFTATQDVASTSYKVTSKLEPAEIMKEPVIVLDSTFTIGVKDSPFPSIVLDSPFTPIVKDNVFTKVAAAKEAIGISTESSFPSVTLPNKFQLQ